VRGVALVIPADMVDERPAGTGLRCPTGAGDTEWVENLVPAARLSIDSQTNNLIAVAEAADHQHNPDRINYLPSFLFI
jgi:hypothetical protein